MVDIAAQANARVSLPKGRHCQSLANSFFQEYFGISKAPSAIVYRDGKELKKTEGMDPQVMKEIMENETASLGVFLIFAVGFVILTLPTGLLFTWMSQRLAVKR